MRKTFATTLLIALALLVSLIGLAGCGPTSSGGVPGHKTYTVRGKTYRPLISGEGFREEGVASWYGPGFHGKKTANGETFNTHAMTAAHKTLPFNSRVKVTNTSNGRSVVVRINDRGPFAHERVIDLSRAAADKIGLIKDGTCPVRIEYLGLAK